MPYIEQVSADEATGAVRREYDAAIRRAGRVWNITAIQSLTPEAMRLSMRMYSAIMYGPSELTRAQREMIAVVTSQANDCHY